MYVCREPADVRHACLSGMDPPRSEHLSFSASCPVDLPLLGYKTFRPRQAEFQRDGHTSSVPWLIQITQSVRFFLFWEMTCYLKLDTGRRSVCYWHFGPVEWAVPSRIPLSMWYMMRRLKVPQNCLIQRWDVPKACVDIPPESVCVRACAESEQHICYLSQTGC